MPRGPRVAPGGLVYHVLNRAVGRIELFRQERDFLAFERIVLETQQRHPLRILSYCVMPNHWHFVVWPRKEGELTGFFKWMTHVHAMRWRVSHRTVGYGPLYQGRFKSFPVQEDEHLLALCRYVERNPLAAGLVRRAESWRWGSLWVRGNGSPQLQSLLSPWPAPIPEDWLTRVARPLRPRDLANVRESLKRSRPLGGPKWLERIVARLGLQHTIRGEGRPKKLRSQKLAPSPFLSVEKTSTVPVLIIAR